MKKIISNLGQNKKIFEIIIQCNHIGFIICLFSFLFTYYYFISFEKNILFISLYLFDFGLSIFIGSLISGIIIAKERRFLNIVSLSFNNYLFNSSKNNLFNNCGFAFPFVSFIACPTKKPKALSLPAL